MDLSPLIRCWEATREQHIINAGAAEEEIVSVERELRLRLPESMRELCRFSDGLTLFGGELSIYPLRNEVNELSLSRATPWLRACNWPIPENLLIFASTGTGEPTGLWTGPHAPRFPEPVIQVGAIFEPACMAVSASAISALLYFVTARGLHMRGATEILRNVLDVPLSLTSLDPHDERAWAGLFLWADPAGFEIVDDPYENPLDAESLERLLN